MVVHYPRTVWYNCYPEHEVTGKTYDALPPPPPKKKKKKKKKNTLYSELSLLQSPATPDTSVVKTTSAFTIAMISFIIDIATNECSILQTTLGAELLEEHVLHEDGNKLILHISTAKTSLDLFTLGLKQVWTYSAFGNCIYTGCLPIFGI